MLQETVFSLLTEREVLLEGGGGGFANCYQGLWQGSDLVASTSLQLKLCQTDLELVCHSSFLSFLSLITNSVQSAIS
jgi:hypothetical protein